jgi:hypothetical protein
MFDREKFKSQAYSSRTATVPVKVLAEFFGEAAPEFIVRGLSFDELAKTETAASSQKTLVALVDALAAANQRDVTQQVRELIGAGENLQPQTIRRQHMLVLATVSPEIDDHVAAKIAENFPVEFKELTDKIIELTGMGRTPGKLPPSGNATTSDPP